MTAEEILHRELKTIYPDIDDSFLPNNEKRVLISAIKAYAKAKLEEAAERAEVICEPDYQGGDFFVVDKQSITNTPLD